MRHSFHSSNGLATMDTCVLIATEHEFSQTRQGEDPVVAAEPDSDRSDTSDTTDTKTVGLPARLKTRQGGDPVVAAAPNPTIPTNPTPCSLLSDCHVRGYNPVPSGRGFGASG